MTLFLMILISCNMLFWFLFFSKLRIGCIFICFIITIRYVVLIISIIIKCSWLHLFGSGILFSSFDYYIKSFLHYLSSKKL